jgi:hypothetical protein
MKSRLSMVAALALASCATSQHQFPPVGENARTATGQVRYEGHGRSVIGDLLVARSGESGRVEFGKGAGVTLIRVLSDGTHMRFEGPLARGTREVARGAKLPGHLVIWSQLAERPVAGGTGSFANDGEKITYQLSLLH